MLVMPTGSVDQKVNLDAGKIGSAIEALGTEDYGAACLDLFGEMFDAAHWAAYVHCADGSVERIVSGSREHMAVVEDAVRYYLAQYRNLDPSLNLATRSLLDRGCVIQLAMRDIPNKWYRRCFEITKVQERLSFYCRRGSNLHQLSIYRSSRRQSYAEAEIKYFTQVAGLMMPMVMKHGLLQKEALRPPRQLDVETLEALLEAHPADLSLRERQVCARAAVGKTIIGTALDLEIKRTSVITYRTRAYQKLGVSCQNELTALLNNFRPH